MAAISHNDCALQRHAEPDDGFEALGDQIDADSFRVATCGDCAGSLFHLVPGHGIYCANCLKRGNLV
jgi:hypothetical protein